jgi:protein O-GlcNAc transferase
LPEAFLLKGSICGANARFDISLAAYEQAIATKPDFADAWFGSGNALAMQWQRAEALASLSAFARHDEALADFDQALRLNPSLAEAWLGRAASSRCACSAMTTR